jgi:hypothetical protein
VRYIQTGFYGPAPGAHHEAPLQMVVDRIEGLLAEPGPVDAVSVQ